VEKDGYYRVSEYPLTTTGTYYIQDNILYNVEGQTDGADLVANEIPDETYDLVVYEYLEIFYKNLISDRLIKGICNCACQDKLVIDTLTIGLEMLKMLEKYKQYYEVYRILKQLETCDDFININCDCNG
jgi:hypothetical protein